MDPVTFDRCCYRLNGEPVHLYSGEFHYFRVPKADWQRRMELFREAGGNCLATYVPWLIHEPREGEFVFGGAEDYCDFYYGSIGEYARRLAGMLRDRGIDTPLITNSPNPGSNLWFLETVQAVPPPFLLGSDHYYSLDQNWRQNNPTPQYAVETFFSCETLRLLGYPPSVFELPGGSASDWPPITPVDAKACYLTNIALGMKGSNFYIYTGGPNLPGTGTTTDLYDYGAPIGAAGEVRPLYQAVKDVGLFLRENAWLAEAGLETGCRFVLDLEMLRTADVWQAPGEFVVSAATAAEFLRKGPLTTAFCAGLAPACCNLGSDDWTGDLETPVVVVCASAMATAKQRRLVRFLEAGGKVLLLPVLPVVDERFEPCTVLADFLGAAAAERNANPAPRISVAGVVNILHNGQSFCWSALPAGAEAIGVDEVSGSPVCWQKATGNGGQAIVLGFRYLHAMREHERLLAALLQRLGYQARLQCSNPNVWCTLRTAGKRSLLFAMNLYSAPMSCELRCRPAWNAGWLDLGHHDLAPMEVRVLPVVAAGVAEAATPRDHVP